MSARLGMFVLAAAMILAVTGVLSSADSADACFLQTNPPPMRGFESGPDCVWRAPDGEPYRPENPLLPATYHALAFTVVIVVGLVVVFASRTSAAAAPPGPVIAG